MEATLRSPQVRWIALFLILAVFGGKWMQAKKAQYFNAVAEQEAQEQTLANADREIATINRIIGTLPKVPADTKPVELRLVDLVRNLREAEATNRIVIQTVVSGIASRGEKRSVKGLSAPLAQVTEISEVPVKIEGQFLTREGLEGFLREGNRTGASITALSVEDNRFKATFTLYGRV